MLVLEASEGAGEALPLNEALNEPPLLHEGRLRGGGGGIAALFGVAGTGLSDASMLFLMSAQQGWSQFLFFEPLACHPIGCLPTSRDGGHATSPSGSLEYLLPRMRLGSTASVTLAEVALADVALVDASLARFPFALPPRLALVRRPPASTRRHCRASTGTWSAAARAELNPCVGKRQNV